MTDSIDRLLSEVEMSDDPELRGLLIEMLRDATSVRPMPSPELAALFAPAQPRSFLPGRRGAITTLIVIGTLGVGVTAAAASPDVRAAAQHVFQAVTGAVHPETSGSDSGTNGISGPMRAPTPSPAHSASPEDSEASDQPQPRDHRNNRGGTGAATPNPPSSHEPTPGNSHATAEPTNPSNSHKP
jgi:hypothetical protein